MPNDPTQPPITAEQKAQQPGTGAVSPSGGALQDVLPEVHALAQKCGGLDKLAEIVSNLRTNKPV